MVRAKIELFSRNVENTECPIFESTMGIPQHLYIIFTNSLGERISLRGGPSNNKMLKGNIEIVKQCYEWDGRIPEEKPYDWDEYGIHSKRILAEGDEQEMQRLVDLMWQKAQEINNNNYDYKIPTLGLSHLQNSNTVVKVMLEAAGLRVILPVDDQGREVFAPGIESTFKHTIADNLIKAGQEIFNELFVENTLKEPEQESLTASKTKAALSKKAKHCKEKIEKAVHNMEQSRLIKTLCEVKLKANEVGSCTPEIYGHLAKVWISERIEKIYKNPMSAGSLDGEVTKLIDCYEYVEYIT